MKKLLILALLALITSTSFSQTADQLYAQGYAAYHNFKWKDASNLLWRYLNYSPPPAELNDPSYKAQVTAAYNYATNPPKPTQNPTPTDDGIAAAVSGLTEAPPPLKKPKLVMLIPSVHMINISGDWVLKIYQPDGSSYWSTLKVSQNGTNISGTLGIVSGTDMPIVGTLEGGILTFTCVSGQTTQAYTLTTQNFINFTGSYKYEGDAPAFGGLTMARRPPR